MFKALQVFQVREALAPAYQVPSVDAVSDGVAPAIPVPAAPTMLHAHPLNLVWSLVYGATGYIVEHRADGTLWTVVATLGDVDIYTSTGLTGLYRVRGFNTSGHGPASVPMAVAFDLPASAPVLTYHGPAPYPALTWTAVPTALTYCVYLMPGATLVKETASLGWAWTLPDWESFPSDPGLTLVVKAHNDAGFGPASNAVLFAEPP